MTEQQAAYSADLAGAIAHANDTLDWIEARQGPLPADGYARIETTVGVVRALGMETTVAGDGGELLLKAAECAWAEQCGSCLNFVHEALPSVLDENARLRERVAELEGWQAGQTHYVGCWREHRQCAREKVESLVDRVAALEVLAALADEVSRLTQWGITVSDCREACEHPACLILRAIARYRKARASLAAGQEQGGAG